IKVLYCKASWDYIFLYFSILCQAWEVQDIPESVRALKGSCVVIPCTVSYPGSPKPTENLVAIWKKSPEEEIFNTQISNDRMKLVGDIGQNNCSLEIKDVQPKDGGPLHFRIVVHGLDISTDLQAGVAVVALCVVKHTCPTHPPKITWTYNTTKSKVQHLAAKDAEWKLTSSITLIPEARQHGEKLTCKVKYWGGMQVETSVVLQVTCEYCQCLKCTICWNEKEYAFYYYMPYKVHLNRWCTSNTNFENVQQRGSANRIEISLFTLILAQVSVYLCVRPVDKVRKKNSKNSQYMYKKGK
uniref:Ig-like domain-containing protein n=1 Tax=Erpetoichthys calabaricus TaxID=27687 RepID=A0A8C4SYC2_ERPCA